MTPPSSALAAPVSAPAGGSGHAQASVGARHRHLRAVRQPVARAVLPLTREVHSAGTAVRGRLSRFVGGTYSPTVERIRFVDGRTALTDLIRLNPGVDAYSVNLDGVAPQAVSRYRPAPWADVAAPGAGDREGAVVRLLSASYPAVDLATLSERVRAAGHPLGRGQLRAHEAIAATQAAIWHVTNGVDLDTSPTSVARSVRAVHDGAERSIRGEGAGGPVHWSGTVEPGKPLHLEFAFDSRPQLGGFAVAVLHGTDLAAIRWHLERSPDGREWATVPASGVHGLDEANRRRVHHLTGLRTIDRQLGVGTTLSDGRGGGFAHYRVVFTTNAPTATLRVHDVRFAVTAAARYRNAERVVHLYRYLLDTLQSSPEPLGDVRLVGPSAAQRDGGDLAGPFFVRGAESTAHLHIAADPVDADLVDRAGRALHGPVAPDQPFFIRTRGSRAVRLTVSLTGVVHHEGHFLLGSRTHDGPAVFTPLALVERCPARATLVFQVDPSAADDLHPPDAAQERSRHLHHLSLAGQ